MGLGGLGMWEMIMIFLVVLLLFGANRLPEIGSSLGKGIREFKGSIKEIEKEVKAVGEPTKDAVPSVTPSPGEPDEGPRRLTTSPVSDAPPVHGGGVPTPESASQEVPAADGPGVEGSEPGAPAEEEQAEEEPTPGVEAG